MFNNFLILIFSNLILLNPIQSKTNLSKLKQDKNSPLPLTILEQKKSYDIEAKRELIKLLNGNSDDWYGYHFNQGEKFYKNKNYIEAKSHFNLAISFKRTDNAYYKRGLSNFSLKKYNSAIYDFERVISINPNWERAYFLRGMSGLLYKNHPEGNNIRINIGCRFIVKAKELGDIAAINFLHKETTCNEFLKNRETSTSIISSEFKELNTSSPSLEDIRNLISGWLLSRNNYLAGKSEFNPQKVGKGLIKRTINERQNDIKNGIYKEINSQISKIDLESQSSSRIVVLVELNYLERIVKNSGEFVNEVSFNPLKVKYILGFSNKSWKLVDLVSGF